MAKDDVVRQIDGAIEVGAAAPRRGRERGGGRWEHLPEDCPVVALGVNGDHSYYLDANRQLRSLKAGDHGRLHIQHLFSPRIDVLWDNWKKYDKEGNVTGWDNAKVSEKLMMAAASAGIWQPENRERGTGAWLGDDGELIVHCGDEILVGRGGKEDPGWHMPGLIGRYVYPAESETPRPEVEPGVSMDGAAADLLQLLESWPWKRGVDATLMLGWLAAAMVGGALDWRPAVWMTGGSGSGKSTLQKLIRLIMGEAGLVQVSDSSAAGIWQKLGHRTLPVALDEQEADQDNRKLDNVVKLARQAASGGLVLRGGQDHKAAEFQARSAFLFSSILVPPLSPQDRSRLAILELGNLPHDAVAPKLDRSRWQAVGTALRWRMFSHWDDMPDMIETYRVALAAAGWDSRGADQFGVLLAAADMALTGGPADGEHAAAMVEKLGHQMKDVDARDEDNMLRWLLTSQVDPYRSGAKKMMGEWIRRAAGGSWAAEFPEAGEEWDTRGAGKVLGLYGLRIEWMANRIPGKDALYWPEVPQATVPVLHFANDHRGLASLFESTHWASRSGTQGVWRQAALRLDGAHAAPRPVYFPGSASVRSVMVPLSTIFPEVEVVAP